jgi:hypothetical protein
MSAAVHSTIDLHHYDLTRHAWERMSGRGLSPAAIRRVLNYGRVAHVRGATIYAVGRKEVRRFQRDGIDLSGLEGVQVVCSESGVVMTVYRNRDFRGLRPRSRRSRRRSW